MKKYSFLLIILSGLITSGCFSWRMVFYREIPMITYYRDDSLVKIHSSYVDKNNNLTVNFNAKLHGNKKVKNYHLKIPTNIEKAEIKRFKSTTNWFKDTLSYHNYNGYIKTHLKRKKIKRGFDTTQINNPNEKITMYNLCINYYDKLDDSYLNNGQIVFQYLPEKFDYFYNIEIQEKVKFDKRFLLPITIPLDIATSPLQLLLIAYYKIEDAFYNRKHPMK